MNPLDIKDGRLLCPQCQTPSDLEANGTWTCPACNYRWDEVGRQQMAAMEAALEHPAKEGQWPQVCVQRAFVEGAKWWEFHQTDGTMWPSDRTLAEDEAVKRYGEPQASAVVERVRMELLTRLPYIKELSPVERDVIAVALGGNRAR